MIALLAATVLAAPPAVALDGCRPVGETWACGDLTLVERNGVVTGTGDAARLEAAVAEWHARGGPGGGPLRVGGVVLDLPLRCWVDGATARCADHSAAEVVAAEAPSGGVHLGDLPCSAAGRAVTCRVELRGDRLTVIARNGPKALVCTPGDVPGRGEACAGLTWDPAALGAPRTVDLFGRALDLHAGCVVLQDPPFTRIGCGGVPALAWGPRGSVAAPDARPQACTVLGMRATCAPLGAGWQAVLEDVPGTVECQAGWCELIGL
jgi:hypothetical protein